MSLNEILPFLIPLIIVEVVLLFITFRHIFTHKNYKHGSRTMWVVITLVGMEIIGPVLYFIFGKEDA